MFAIIANLLAQHTVAAIAFWLRDAGSGWFLYMKAVFILGGMIIPLELLPDALAARGDVPALPRRWPTRPARLAAGFWEPGCCSSRSSGSLGSRSRVAAAFAAGERRLQVVGG